ncbi:hypothetical protein GIB67_012869 [Kingdonia uniflora]|uniref:F-box associated domain-containing protein n=1 Tax=Kingdonia uniflora TaxID=39325 RepID=A0A7J7NG59_9MAGN|nr:hypothetical protein GIB67_012869 [Kingdonia uniflora]
MGLVAMSFAKNTKWFKLSTLAKISKVRRIFLNGAIHWVTNTEGGSFVSIIYFDIKNKKFQVMLQAGDILGLFGGRNEEIYDGDVTPPKRLGVLGGCLCMFGKSYTIDYVVFVMRDYGVKESWTLLHTTGVETIDYPTPHSDRCDDLRLILFKEQ